MKITWNTLIYITGAFLFFTIIIVVVIDSDAQREYSLENECYKQIARDVCIQEGKIHLDLMRVSLEHRKFACVDSLRDSSELYFRNYLIEDKNKCSGSSGKVTNG